VSFTLGRISNVNAFCYLRYQDDTQGYFINFRGPVPAEGNDPGAVRLLKLDDENRWTWGSWQVITASSFPNTNDEVHDIDIDVIGAAITVFVDGAELLSWQDPTPVLSGRIGLAGFTGATAGNSHNKWDNVVVTDLTGVAAKATSWSRIKKLLL
jgi:hypothetical protein